MEFGRNLVQLFGVNDSQKDRLAKSGISLIASAEQFRCNRGAEEFKREAGFLGGSESRSRYTFISAGTIIELTENFIDHGAFGGFSNIYSAYVNDISLEGAHAKKLWCSLEKRLKREEDKARVILGRLSSDEAFVASHPWVQDSSELRVKTGGFDVRIRCDDRGEILGDRVRLYSVKASKVIGDSFCDCISVSYDGARAEQMYKRVAEIVGAKTI